jgi:predicted N-acetyltransferase YhbS
VIREERPGDVETIAGVIERAFAAAEHRDGTEAQIVERLRAAGALALSLVAERDGAVVGHAAFSPVTVNEAQGWFGLGPVAVEPERQGQGIGAALIEAGLARLRSSGAQGCVVLGDPAYYARFGFRVVRGLTYPGAPAEYFQALAFSGHPPRGEVRYHPAFG